MAPPAWDAGAGCTTFRCHPSACTNDLQQLIAAGQLMFDRDKQLFQFSRNLNRGKDGSSFLSFELGDQHNMQ